MKLSEKMLIYGDIAFDAKPDAVPYNYRISYKVTQLCLILRICGRGDACSLIKMQMISFALFSRDNLSKLIDFSSGLSFLPIVRFDPAVNRALAYANAYGFVEQQKSGNYKLTKRGKNLADQVIHVGDLMRTEIDDLNSLAKKLTETRINELVEMWGDKYAEN